MDSLIAEQIFSFAGSAETFVDAGAEERLTFQLVNTGAVALEGGTLTLIDLAGSLSIEGVVIDGTPCQDPQRLRNGGVRIDLPAGTACDVAIQARLENALENASTLRWQMVYEHAGVALGSNIVTAIARSAPRLVVRATTIEDGGAKLHIVIANEGSAAAHAVRVLARLPKPHDECIGDILAGGVRDLVLPIDTTLAQRTGMLVMAPIRVRSAETEPQLVAVESRQWGEALIQAQFAPQATTRPFESGDDVTFQLDVINEGEAPASDVVVRLPKVPELEIARGSVRRDLVFIDSSTRVAIPWLAGKSTVRLQWSARVGAVATERVFDVEVLVNYGRSQTRAVTQVRACSMPRISCASVAADRDSVFPGESAEFHIVLANAGTAASGRLRLTLHVDAEALAVKGDGGAAAVTNSDDRWSFELAPIACAEAQEFSVAIKPRQTATSSIPVTLTAELDGEVVVLFERMLTMLPQLGLQGNVRTEIGHTDVHRGLRYGEEATAIVSVTNTGDGPISNVSIEAVPAEGSELLAVEPATISLDRLGSGQTKTAEVTVRLTQACPETRVLPLLFVVEGEEIGTVRLAPAFLRTFAAARLEGELASSTDAAFAGDVVTFTLSIENTGDGNAHRLILKSEAAAAARYVPGTTTVNGHAIPDCDAGALLELDGIIFGQVQPEAKVIVTWQSRVSEKAHESWLTPIVRATWDRGVSTIFAGRQVPVHGVPRLVAALNDASFALGAQARIVPVAAIAPVDVAPKATNSAIEDGVELPSPGVQPLPPPDNNVVASDDAQHSASSPAEPKVAELNGVVSPSEISSNGATHEPAPAATDTGDAATPAAAASVGDGEIGEDQRSAKETSLESTGGDGVVTNTGGQVKVSSDVNGEYLAKLVHYLQACSGRGLLTHIIALGRLIATSCVDDEVFSDVVENTRSTIHQIFVRSNMRDFRPRAEDLESVAMRASIEAWLERVTGVEQPALTDLGLYAELGNEELEAMRSTIESAPIGGLAVYILLAHLIPSLGSEEALARALGAYSEAFITTLHACPDDESFATYIMTAEVQSLDEKLALVVSAASESAQRQGVPA